ncbi:MAG: hypothetical protein BIFFINMI_01492 [Phycisphaerae bacterium]|nr:hypothetical protein [Phycisphaerae bacterium]
MRISVIRLCAGMLLLGPALTLQAADPPATTAPDAGDLSTAELLRLARSAGEPTSALVWGKPTTWDFNDKLDIKGWTSDSVTIARRADCWELVPTGRFVLCTPLPRGVNADTGFRVDVWLRCWSPKEAPIRGAVFVGPGGNPFDFTAVTYDFEMNESGKQQQINCGVSNMVSKQEELKWGRLVHVTLQIAGAQASGSRDACEPLRATISRNVAGNPAGLSVGLAGWLKKVELVRMSIRSLEQGRTAPASKADQVAADRARLKEYLLGRVFPDLDNRSYDVRRKASELLDKLGLAAAEAAGEALKSGKVFGPEARTRLEQIAAPPDVRNVDLDRIPAPDLAEAPTTQPDEDSTPTTRPAADD